MKEPAKSSARFYVVRALFVIVLLITAALLWYCWDAPRNHGLSFGYYGEFNRVSNTLASVPGVIITQEWANADVSLEEFGFGLTVTGRPIRLFFGERDPVRKMNQEDAMADLIRRIGKELEKPETNK